jgi:hypothetical protein
MQRAVFLCGLFWMNLLPSLLACEGCKEPSNVAGASGVSGISAGFSWSVLFMLFSVASIIGGMTLMIVRSCRKLEAAREVAAAGTH